MRGTYIVHLAPYTRQTAPQPGSVHTNYAVVGPICRRLGLARTWIVEGGPYQGRILPTTFSIS